VHRNARRVQEELRRAGSQAEIVELTDSARTADEAAAAIGTSVAQIAKSLVFAGAGPAVLVIASGRNRVSIDKVSEQIGSSIARADADTVRRVTGFPIGGVPPLGHATAMTVLIDADLVAFDEVWAAGGTPHTVFRTTGEELRRLTGGVVADIKET
jgi:prolyl-tRNA editing enzyme YbaK/EbsC (Cys-tRNA(Pro) deacylase)